MSDRRPPVLTGEACTDRALITLARILAEIARNPGPLPNPASVPVPDESRRGRAVPPIHEATVNPRPTRAFGLSLGQADANSVVLP